MTTALLVKMSSLGDIVHALPALTDAALAGVTFDWVVEEAFAPIAARHPAVRTVIPVAWRRWRSRLLPSREEMQSFLKRLRMTDYDVILDSQGLIKSAAISRLARGAVRAGYDSDSAREPLAALINDRRISVPREQHAIDRQRQLFAKALGYALPGGLAFGIGTHPEGSDQLDHRLCLLLHGTTWASKHYPEAFWFDILARARADGYTVAVTWGDGTERARAERFAAKGALVWPKMSLAELTERISRVSLAIGVDSGLTHLAAALERPTVGLYGSTDATLTGVRGRHAISLAADFPCSPCRSAICRYEPGQGADTQTHGVQPACFATLPPLKVWQAALRQARGD